MCYIIYFFLSDSVLMRNKISKVLTFSIFICIEAVLNLTDKCFESQNFMKIYLNPTFSIRNIRLSICVILFREFPNGFIIVFVASPTDDLCHIVDDKNRLDILQKSFKKINECFILSNKDHLFDL